MKKNKLHFNTLQKYLSNDLENYYSDSGLPLTYFAYSWRRKLKDKSILHRWCKDMVFYGK